MGAGPGAKLVGATALQREADLKIVRTATLCLNGCCVSQLTAVDDGGNLNHHPLLRLWLIRIRGVLLDSLAIRQNLAIGRNRAGAVERGDSLSFSRIGRGRGRICRANDVRQLEPGFTLQAFFDTLRLLPARHLQKDLMRALRAVSL